MKDQQTSFNALLKEFMTAGRSVMVISPAVAGCEGRIMEVQSDHIRLKVVRSTQDDRQIFFDLYLPMYSVFGVEVKDDTQDDTQIVGDKQ